MATYTIEEAKEVVAALSIQEKEQLLQWLQGKQKENAGLSNFSFVISHSVLEKEWLNEKEDKAWESL